MIDKKIEEAVRYYCNNRYPASQDAPFIAEGFRKGARWAINEFLKDLWHPAEEEPNHESDKNLYLGKTEASESGLLPMLLRPNTNWKEFVVSHGVTNWLYADDILPKKEGGEK